MRPGFSFGGYVLGMPTFANLAPEEAIRTNADGPPPGHGVTNPPSVADMMSRMGMAPAPVGDKAVPKTPEAPVGNSELLIRRPFAITCQSWLEQHRYILCKVNPRNVQWNESLRVSDQKTLSGTVQHAWRPQAGFPRRTYFSEPVLTITFQSGNTMPVKPDMDNADQPVADTLPAGLRNFYEFKSLLNESRIVSPDSGSRAANVVYIMYTSRTLPSIVLAGMFTPEGISWSDNSEDPNKIEWTTSFTVYDSYPRFDNGASLQAAWTAASHPVGPSRTGKARGDAAINTAIKDPTAQLRAAAGGFPLASDITP